MSVDTSFADLLADLAPEDVEAAKARIDKPKAAGRIGYAEPILFAFYQSGADAKLIDLEGLNKVMEAKHTGPEPYKALTAQSVTQNLRQRIKARNFPIAVDRSEDEVSLLKHEAPKPEQGLIEPQKRGRKPGSPNGNGKGNSKVKAEAAEQ
jgi:hypothetical protein